MLILRIRKLIRGMRKVKVEIAIKISIVIAIIRTERMIRSTIIIKVRNKRQSLIRKKKLN